MFRDVDVNQCGGAFATEPHCHSLGQPVDEGQNVFALVFQLTRSLQSMHQFQTT